MLFHSECQCPRVSGRHCARHSFCHRAARTSPCPCTASERLTTWLWGRCCCEMHVNHACHMHEPALMPGSGPVMYDEQHI